MDPQVQASFIPKRSLDVSAPRGGSGGGLMFLIALLVFVASLVAAGSAFAYTQYLTNAIASKSKSLQLAEGAYDPGTIQDLVRIDSRLTHAKTLLGKHVAVSGIFNFLSQQTLVNVAFTSLDYTLGSDGGAKVVLNGTADSFSSLALQSDQFNGNKLLKDVLFSSITVDPATRRVNFSVTATVDPSVLNYAATLGAGAVAVPAATGAAQGGAQPATTTSH
jgi:hypothetical protein